MSVFPPTRLVAPSCGTWHIDSDASTVEFAIDERMAFVKRRTVTGRFSGVTGTIALDEERPANSRVNLTIDAGGIDTGEPRRDKNLRGKPFFDTERFPIITFTSRWCDAADAATGRYRAIGYLTIRDVTREVELEVECEPSRPAVRITATGVLNRRDFGMTWGNSLLWIADEVRVQVTIQAVSMLARRAA
jgi:polyisoprenoid-binding protein YceI